MPEDTQPVQRRLNRPKDKDDLLQQLTEHGPFHEYRDVLVFAAALGWYEGQRVPLGAKGEPIRWEAATNRRGTEVLANMIGAAATDDAEIVSPSRFEERLAIFEEYANGGLERLRGALAEAGPRPPLDVILALVQKACRADKEPDPVDLSSLADDLQW